MSQEADFIYHIVPAAQWILAQAKGQYEGDTLLTEGFIHCSRSIQVLKVANSRFRGMQGLLLIEIDPLLVTSPIRHEDDGLGEKFPHIYGALNLESVVAVFDFSPDTNGYFILPRQ